MHSKIKFAVKYHVLSRKDAIQSFMGPYISGKKPQQASNRFSFCKKSRLASIWKRIKSKHIILSNCNSFKLHYILSCIICKKNLSSILSFFATLPLQEHIGTTTKTRSSIQLLTVELRTWLIVSDLSLNVDGWYPAEVRFFQWICEWMRDFTAF